MKAKPKKGIDREFLYYFLKQDAVLQYVERLSARTGGQTGVDLVSLNKYPVRVPNDIQDQRRLVASLVAIDKKIELNNRINTELEAMAKTLYDYWFVQFDFPDDSPQGQGKPYKTSGGKMIYNPTLKREIPEGWSKEVLGKIINMERGVTYGKEDVLDKDNDNAIGVLRATNVTGNSVDINDLVYVPKSIVNQTQKIESFETIIVMSSGSKEQ